MAPKKAREPFSAPAVLGALETPIPKTDPPATYVAAVGGLAAFLVLMSAVYLALVGFVGWLAGWHLVQAVVSLQYGPYFVFHLPMALLGLLLLVFLVKPVFFRRKSKDQAPITITREDEPLLFATVEKLCAAAGAPMPEQIEVDCEANAGARLSSAVGGVLGGKLVLRIGLPLAAGLTVRQFVGVIAHELGHFNQRGGMAGSYLVRKLSGFFVQVVFQRDRLDEKLSNLRHHRNGLARLAYYGAVALVEPARGVLWLMLLAGELTTCGVLRRMEHDADEMEAHVAGIDGFVRTGKLLLFLDLAVRRARGDLASAWEQQRLADDFPKLVVGNARQLAEHRADILKLLECTRTRWLDTHPCHNDRAAHVQRLGAAGMLNCDAGARNLFTDFSALCRRATVALYCNVLGEAELGKARLVPAKELVDERAGERQAHKALNRFFQGHVVGRRPVFPSIDEANAPAADVATAKRELAEVRDALVRAAPTLGPAARKFSEAAAVLPVAQAQLMLCKLFAGAAQVAKVQRKADATLRKFQPILGTSAIKLAELDGPARHRLTLALQLLHDDRIAARLGKDLPVVRKSVHQWLTICMGLEQALPDVNRMADLATTIRVLWLAYDERRPYQPLVQRILAASNEAVKLLRDMRWMLEVVPYPFAHGMVGTTVAAALLPQEPDANNPADTFAAVMRFVDRYAVLTFRVLAHLTEVAERIETAIGLDRLPEPEDVDDPEVAEAERTQNARNTRRYWVGYGVRAAAGIALVVGLVRLSLSPPELPTMPWQHARVAGIGGGSTYRYRPASFYAPAASSPSSGNPWGTATGVPGAAYNFGTRWPARVVEPQGGGYRGRVVNVSPSAPGVDPSFPATGNPLLDTMRRQQQGMRDAQERQNQQLQEMQRQQEQRQREWQEQQQQRQQQQQQQQQQQRSWQSPAAQPYRPSPNSPGGRAGGGGGGRR